MILWMNPIRIQIGFCPKNPSVTIPLTCTPVVFIINVASGAKKFVHNVTKNKDITAVTIRLNEFPLLAITHIGVT